MSAEHLARARSLKGVGNMFDGGAATCSGPGDCHHVESRRIFKEPVTFQVTKSEPRETLLLVGVDRLRRMSRAVAGTSLHLDKDYCSPVQSNQIELSEPVPISPGKDLITAPAQVPSGLALTRRLLDAMAKRDEHKVQKIYGEMMQVSREYLTRYRRLFF